MHKNHYLISDFFDFDEINFYDTTINMIRAINNRIPHINPNHIATFLPDFLIF